MNEHVDIDPDNPDAPLGNFAHLVKHSEARWRKQADQTDARTAKFLNRMWQADRDDAILYSDFTPIDDPEPIQRDLFK